MRDDFRCLLDELNPDALILEPEYMDEAVIGIAVSGTPVLVYDTDKVVELLMIHEGFNLQDAIEWNEYNIIGSKGEHYPIHITTDWYRYA
jgi:hypothetical protein|tara:strand:- start:261 stop:530 length:270 start_codon:yes stop_codon:yes gene_type:complete